MSKKYCGTEVLGPKEVAVMRNSSVPQARIWIKHATKALKLPDNADFTVLDYSRHTNIPLKELKEMLNEKLAEVSYCAVCNTPQPIM